MPTTLLAAPTAAAELVTLVQGLDLKISHQPTQSLVAYGRKTRTHTKAHIELMAKVMSEFGCIVPIIVDENSKVLAGNGRVEAARILGLASVPTVKVSHLRDRLRMGFPCAGFRDSQYGCGHDRREAGWPRSNGRPSAIRPI